MTEKNEIGYAYNLSYDIGNGRSVSLTGNFGVGATLEQMNAEFDKVRTVFDRQQAKSALNGVEQDIEKTEMLLQDAVGDMLRIGEKQGDRPLSANDRQAKESATVHVEKMKKNLEYKKCVYEKIKKEAS